MDSWCGSFSNSLDGWAGRSGHDAPMIAYDALMAAKKNWAQLCSRYTLPSARWLQCNIVADLVSGFTDKGNPCSRSQNQTVPRHKGRALMSHCRAMFHAGDSDSTGVIAAAWFGALFGYAGVPECNYSNLEYRKRLEEQGQKLYKLSHPE